MKEKMFSAVKPTGRLTLGNYIGTMKNWAKMQEDYDCIFCVADLHSLTVHIDPEELRQNSYALMAVYLACGLSPDKGPLYYQSQIPAHSELCWLLNCVANVGETNRMTAYKEKAHNKDGVSVGLFDYPILMAADILLFDTKYVPIGEDQRQHMEMARNLAIRFNNKYGETFVLPEGVYQKTGSKITNLQNPTKKMSKSDCDDSGNILLEDDLDIVRQKIKRAVTDSGSEIKVAKDKPGVTNLLSIYSSLSGLTLQECEKHFAGKNYGALKNEVADIVVNTLQPFQEKFRYYLERPTEIEKIATRGAEQLRERANKKVLEVKRKMGLIF